jgi:hypothetical protein
MKSARKVQKKRQPGEITYYRNITTDTCIVFQAIKKRCDSRQPLYLELLMGMRKIRSTIGCDWMTRTKIGHHQKNIKERSSTTKYRGRCR